MANIRELNRKISSLWNMKKVMSAMNMIASTKFSKLLTRQAALLKFEESLSAIQESLFKMLARSSHPLVTGAAQPAKTHLIIFTADRGLCGAHNSSVLKAAAALIKKAKNNGGDFDITAVGLKGANFCRKKEFPLYHSIDINEKSLTDEDILRIARTVVNRFQKGEISEVYVIFNRFASALSQPTITKKILPLSIPTASEDNSHITCDLSPRELAVLSVPLLIFYRLKSVLANSYISEHGARMTAMENASNNSQDLIDRYGTIKNRARQTAITNELTEIVSGKEAMK